jgi:hypothetical protein
MRRFLLLATAALASLAIAAPVALAGGDENLDLGSSHGLHYYELLPQNGIIGPSSITNTTFCQASGYVAVGGGASVGSLGTDQLAETEPFDFAPKPIGWQIGIRNSGNSPITYLGFAVCLEAGGRGVTYPFRIAHAVPPAGSPNLRVRCPDGSVVIGGGAAAGNLNASLVTASRPFDDSDRNSRPDDGWRSAITNDSTTTEDMTGYAICTSRDTTSYSYRHSPRAPVASGASVDLEASCNISTAVVSGGGSITGAPGAVWIAAAWPADDARDADTTPDNQWHTAFTSGQDPGITEAAQAWAVCKSA